MSSYLDRLLRHLENPRAQSDGWLASCPCTYHGGTGEDRHPSLRLTIGEEGRLLLHCRSGCRTEDILDSIGLNFAALYPSPGEEAQEALTHEPYVPSADEKDLWHEVYLALLEASSLEKEEKQELKKRRLDKSPELYRTFSAAEKVLKVLRDRFGDKLHMVPGFNRDGSFRLQGPGLLIPCRNARGEIHSLKLRARSGEPRYLLFSGGNGSVALEPHIPLAAQDAYLDSPGVVRITEGELKAESAFVCDGVPTISVPGVASWACCLEELRSLIPAPELHLAFDWPDVQKKPGVARQLLAFQQELARWGWATRTISWSESHKGLDDLLLAGHSFTVSDSHTLSIRDTFSTEEKKPSLFPIEVFTPPLRELITKISASLQCPVDFPAVAMLSLASAAIGNTRVLAIRDEWQEAANLYVCLIGSPGTGKSPSLSILMRPFLAELRGRGLEDLFTTDVTVERMADLLESSSRGVLLFREEISGWVASFNAYRPQGKGADRQFFLSAWSRETLKVDRKGKDKSASFLERPYLSVLGGIQPGLLKTFTKETSDDGFQQRLLFAFPTTKLPVDWIEEGITTEDLFPWQACLSWLFSLSPGEEGKTEVARLSEETAEAWADWYRAHWAEARDDFFEEENVGLWSKLQAYCGRLTLLLHLLHGHDHDEPVSVEIFTKAACLVEYFKAHGRRVQHALGAHPEDRRIAKVLEFINKQPGKQATARELQRATRIETRSDLDKVLARLLDLDLVHRAAPPPGKRGRKSDIFCLGGEEE